MLLIATVCVAVSCDSIYDNVEKYVDGEIVYIDKLDGIINVQIGYERVEIDLLRAGRIPSSQIRMAKASKMVIECPDFTEPGNRRVIDSICSWVNVTGLTQLKFYELTIYTEDEYGNRSLPMKTNVKPYTAENLSTIEITPPYISASSTSAQIEWLEGVSALTHKVVSYSWQFTDRDGAVISYGDEGDNVVIFLENIASETDIPVNLMCRIIPMNFGSDNNYTPIIDTVDFQKTLSFRLSSDADDVIFLKGPESGFESDLMEGLSASFSWTKTDAADGYTLKFSLLPNFPDESTYSIDVGDVNEYVMSNEDMLIVYDTLATSDFVMDLYWTVTPTIQIAPVKTAYRILKFWKQGVFYQYDRNGWVFLEASSTLGGYPGQNMLDNNLVTFWHSSGTALPHWVVIDMITPKNIYKFDVYRAMDNYSDTKRMELYVGNTSNPEGAWTKIGEGAFSPNTLGTQERFIEVLTFDNTTEGRYLKIHLLDGRTGSSNPYVNICEIFLYYQR